MPPVRLPAPAAALCAFLACGAVVDKARPENLRAMIDFTKEYGAYK